MILQLLEEKPPSLSLELGVRYHHPRELPRACFQHPCQRTVAKASLPRHGADLVGLRGHCDAQFDLGAERDVWGCLEGEFLEQRREEEEELGAGQQLTQAGALPCGESHRDILSLRWLPSCSRCQKASAFPSDHGPAV